MTLLEIKTAAAAYHEKAVSDLSQLSLDLGLVALNQAKQTAQLGHDFNFQRKLLTLDVNSVTGGSLDAAVLQGTATTADIKTIVNIGVFDTNNNFRPVPWTTAEEGQGRALQENRFWSMPWGGRDDPRSPYGTGRFIIRNGFVYLWPIGEGAAFTTSIGIEAYVFDADWTASDLAASTVVVTGTLSPAATGIYSVLGTFRSGPIYSKGTGYYVYRTEGDIWVLAAEAELLDNPTNYWEGSATLATIAGTYSPQGTNTGTATVALGTGGTSDVWTTRGSQYLLWQTVINLNKLFKSFVPRQEGNLAEPQALADAGLQALVLWDDYKLEGFRTHGR